MLPEPTAANVAYGTHERQVLDFWKAESDKPTPLVLCIHGGGWNNGSKEGYRNATTKRYLDAGISVVAINYRMVPVATPPKLKSRVLAPPAVRFMYIRSMNSPIRS